MGANDRKSSHGEKSTPPNVLILHCDQMRYDALGCHGFPGNPTPNLDKLASMGLDFSRHFSCSPICMPSRAGFFTGHHVSRHGVWGNGVPLNRKEYSPFGRSPFASEQDGPRCLDTMADTFSGAGYRTAAFGKLHLTPTVASPAGDYPESDQAFARYREEPWHGPYFGFQHVELTHAHGENPGGHYDHWLQQEHPDVHTQVRLNWGRAEKPVPDVPDLYRSVLTDETHPNFWLVDKALDWIAHSGEKPFFCFLGFPDPHHPFVPLQEDLAYFDGIQMPQPVDPEGTSCSDESGFGQDVRHLKAEDHDLIRRYTAAMVRTIDRAVGSMTHRLEEMGKWENTIVLFTSDHGDYLGDHGCLRKSQRVRNNLIHVPCILHIPKTSPSSVCRLNKATSNVDIMPTLLELAGVTKPFTGSGCSLLAGETPSVISMGFGQQDEDMNITLLDERFRYTYFPHTQNEELFDHTQDPGECLNLSGAFSEQCREFRQELANLYLHECVPCAGRVASW